MRLCVFDLDHTLVRSPLDLGAMALDMRGHLEDRWRPLPTRSERYRVGELIALCQAEVPALEPDLWSIALDHERKAVGTATLEPGAMEAVRGARAVGFHTALWTNNAREITLHVLARFGLDALLDITVTRDEMRQLKPHPDGWRVIVQMMGGPDMAPQTPQRSERPGKPGTLLDIAPAFGGPDMTESHQRASHSWRNVEGHPGSAGVPRAMGGLGGPLAAPYNWRNVEGRPGSPGVLRATGGLGGPLEAPHGVVVGDSWVDGAAAGAAGVPFIAYRTNPRDLERWQVTPIATLSDLGDLPALLTKLRESG